MKKKLSTLFATGTLALILSAPVLAGLVGVSKDYTVTASDATTIAELQRASETALREGREGNKNNPAFARKSDEDEQLIARLESGKPTDEKQIDEALQPVWVW
jgi:hypothetical protein